VVGAITGLGIDRGLWRPLERRGTGLIAMLVITIGVGILIRYVFLYQFGGFTRTYADYQLQTEGLELGPVTIVPRDLATILISLGVLVAVALALQLTRIGKAMRAVADNRDLAESSGIDVERVVGYVWAAGAGLAALGGVLLGLAEQVDWLMGFRLLLLMFAGVILGGIGTAYGALIGSIVIGLLVQLSTLWVAPELQNVVALLVLIIILIVRPQSIQGPAERVRWESHGLGQHLQQRPGVGQRAGRHGLRARRHRPDPALRLPRPAELGAGRVHGRRRLRRGHHGRRV